MMRQSSEESEHGEGRRAGKMAAVLIGLASIIGRDNELSNLKHIGLFQAGYS